MPHTQNTYSLMCSYRVGSMAIFFASVFWHKIASWKPNIYQSGSPLTPGRIGTAFFFPLNSLRVLEGKPEGWAADTAYGRWLEREGEQLDQEDINLHGIVETYDTKGEVAI